jgi:hypothetical protein
LDDVLSRYKYYLFSLALIQLNSFCCRAMRKGDRRRRRRKKKRNDINKLILVKAHLNK